MSTDNGMTHIADRLAELKDLMQKSSNYLRNVEKFDSFEIKELATAWETLHGCLLTSLSQIGELIDLIGESPFLLLRTKPNPVETQILNLLERQNSDHKQILEGVYAPDRCDGGNESMTTTNVVNPLDRDRELGHKVLLRYLEALGFEITETRFTRDPWTIEFEPGKHEYRMALGSDEENYKTRNPHSVMTRIETLLEEAGVTE